MVIAMHRVTNIRALLNLLLICLLLTAVQCAALPVLCDTSAPGPGVPLWQLQDIALHHTI
jgi:hypothetical protein